MRFIDWDQVAMSRCRLKVCIWRHLRCNFSFAEKELISRRTEFISSSEWIQPMRDVGASLTVLWHLSGSTHVMLDAPTLSGTASASTSEYSDASTPKSKSTPTLSCCHQHCNQPQLILYIMAQYRLSTKGNMDFCSISDLRVIESFCPLLTKNLALL